MTDRTWASRGNGTYLCSMAGAHTLPQKHGPRRRLPRSFIWIAGGAAIVVVLLALSILAPEDSNDRAPAWLIALVFWVASAVGGFFVVKGLLMVMRKLDRRRSLMLAAGMFLAMVAAIILHAVIYALFDVEEGVFFIFALFVAPVLIVAALIRAVFPGKRE